MSPGTTVRPFKSMRCVHADVFGRPPTTAKRLPEICTLVTTVSAASSV